MSDGPTDTAPPTQPGEPTATAASDLAEAKRRCEAARWPEQHRDDCAWCATFTETKGPRC